MSEQALEGEIVPVPPDNNPANVMDGPSGLASRTPDIAFLFESGEKAEEQMTDNYRAIIEQILSAETPDQILTPVEVLQPRDVADELLEVFDVRWQRSEFEVGSPMYASLEAKRIMDGAPVVVNCGQKPVMAQLVRMQQLDAFPFRAFFRQTGNNAHGTAMYRLTMAKGQSPNEPPF